MTFSGETNESIAEPCYTDNAYPDYWIYVESENLSFEEGYYHDLGGYFEVTIPNAQPGDLNLFMFKADMVGSPLTCVPVDVNCHSAGVSHTF